MILVCAIHCSKCVTFISLNSESHNDCQSHYADHAMKAQRDQAPSPWLYSSKWPWQKPRSQTPESMIVALDILLLMTRKKLAIALVTLTLTIVNWKTNKVRYISLVLYTWQIVPRSDFSLQPTVSLELGQTSMHFSLW